MQNKIKTFKQLSQEFADRKGYEVEYSTFIKQINVRLSKNNNKKFSFIHASTGNFDVWDSTKCIDACMDLDQFKKLIKEL